MEIRIGQLIFQVVNFAILLFLLNKFLYRPILRILEERAARIKEGLEAAEKSIAEKATLEEKKKKMLVDAEKQSNVILQQAQDRAKKVEKEIVAQAKKEAEKLVQKEQRLLLAKIDQDRSKLQRQVADLVVDTTQAVLEKSLTQKEQKAIINRQIAYIKNVKIN